MLYFNLNSYLKNYLLSNQTIEKITDITNLKDEPWVLKGFNNKTLSNVVLDMELKNKVEEPIEEYGNNGGFDIVIGNPPYSIFEDFLKKGFELADNVSYLVPTNKIFQRQIIMEMINRYGGIKSIIIYGSGQLIDFPFGFSVGNFHFEKGYKGETKVLMGMKSIFGNGQ